MYNLLEQKRYIDNNFRFLNKTLFYQKKDESHLYWEEQGVEKKVFIGGRTMDIVFNTGAREILVILDSGKGLLFTEELQQKPLNEELNYYSRKDIDDYVILTKGMLFDKIYGVFSLSRHEILFETKELVGLDIFEDKIYRESDGVVTCRHIETGEIQWQFPLSPYGEYFQNGEYHAMDVQKFLGVYESVFYLIAGNRLILGIDVATGKEVYKFEYTEKVGGLKNTELDIDSGTIFSLGPNHYVEINLETPECKVFDISESVAKYGLEGERLGSWENNLIYFWEGSRNNRFGIFDRNLREIIWSEEIPEVKDHFPAIINVKHGGDKLYVHDINLTLHIFEKE